MLVNFDNDVDVNDWEGRLTPPPLITFATSMLDSISLVALSSPSYVYKLQLYSAVTSHHPKLSPFNNISHSINITALIFQYILFVIFIYPTKKQNNHIYLSSIFFQFEKPSITQVSAFCFDDDNMFSRVHLDCITSKCFHRFSFQIRCYAVAIRERIGSRKNRSRRQQLDSKNIGATVLLLQLQLADLIVIEECLAVGFVLECRL